MDVYKRVENTGDSSGIYGSQERKEVKVSGSIQLLKNLQLSSHCIVSAADTNFDEKNTTRKSHMVTANVELNYKVLASVTARANLTHRTYLSDHSVQKSPDGVQGSLSVNFAAF